MATKSWKQRIDEARKRGCFTGEDTDLAGKWTSCACGEIDNIPRRPDGEPLDEALQNLGFRFYRAVRGYGLLQHLDMFSEAELLITQISERAGKILRDQVDVLSLDRSEMHTGRYRDGSKIP